jgi:secondary thiamine-phosphate synthase enzyme
MVYQEEFSLKTCQKSQWLDINNNIIHIISSSAIITGICFISSLHTTAGITINENADPDVETDFFNKLNQLVPVESFFRHCEGNSDSHIKASLMGFSAQIPIKNGKLVLGTWQSVYFCEFDGPRSRRVSVTAIGE